MPSRTLSPAPASLLPAPRGWLSRRGSTRSLALTRIALALIALAQLGGEMQLFNARDALSLALSVAFFPVILAMLLGFHTRAACSLSALTLCGIYQHCGVALERPALTRHQSWLLVVAVTALAFSPCGRSLSIDRLRSGRSEHGELWALQLLRLQVSVVYFWGAVLKLNLPFLRGERLEQILMAEYYGTTPVPPWLSGLLPAAAACVIALELALCFGLWSARLRRWLIPLGIALHASFHVLLPVGTFSVLMLCLYLAFVSPARVAVVVERLCSPADWSHREEAG